MEILCDLEVDINGQHIFWVNKKILAQFSSKLSNLLFEKKCINDSKETRIVFQDFPGGASSFELITRFIYNNGIIDITHSNVLFLNHVAKYMELNKNVFGRPNLIDQTEKFLMGIEFWTWFELVQALTHGQCLLADVHPVSSIRRLIEEVVERIASRCTTTSSSLSNSSKCSSFRSSCDSKSTLGSIKSAYFHMFWWFEDLSSFSIDLVDLLVRKMVLENFDHHTISKFLFYYQRVKVRGTSSKAIRAKIIENIVDLLYEFDMRNVLIKGLFETLRVASNLNIRKSCKRKLELLIGLQLDQATIDDLILPSSRKNKNGTMYNVNLVIRILKKFLLEGNVSHKLCSYRLKKVTRVVDLYASEIAPDSGLKPSKFITLARIIPESARDSCDKLYQAIELYLEAHPNISEEQKLNICATLNYTKLSTRVLNRLSRNANFPLLAIVKALVHQNPKLRSSVKNPNHLKFFKSLGCKGHEAKMFMLKDEVLVKELTKNKDKFRVHLHNMGWTVVELEHILGKLQTHYVTNVIDPKMCCANNVKRLPKLCS